VQIDYFTIAAQIVNFLILILLLRHFLYGPVLLAMDEREKRIASRLDEAEQKEREAERNAESYRRAQQEISEKRQDMLDTAAREAAALRSDLMKRAREEVEESKARWYEDLEHQKSALLADLGRQAGELTYAIARRVLKDLADQELERQIVTAFLRRLQSMDEEERMAIREFFRDPGQQITVRSSFEIPEELQEKIKETARDQTGTDVRMTFGNASQLIAGVEMSAHNMRIAWSIASYMETLQDSLSKILDQRMPGEGIKEREGGKAPGGGGI